MNLVIVESPTKAKTLSRFLGEGFVVEATMGHIKDLPKSKLGVDVEDNFNPDYVAVEKRKDSIKKIQKAAESADTVFIATDPDREGEAIAQHVKEILKNSKISRIVFHEITKEAVDAAIGNPRGVDSNLVDAQVARRVLDRLVGYKLSPLLWRKVRRGLSAGRVQSVTVRLIVEKEEEIKAFKQEEYWEVFVDLKTKEKNVFSVILTKIQGEVAKVEDEKSANSITRDLKRADYVVSDVNKKEVRKRPYAPFTTSTMTIGAARLFGWSAKRTMATAQKLYEEGLITYHRTDSTNIASSALSKVRDFIKKNYGEDFVPVKPNIYKTKSKVAQEAHEAIRPTGTKKEVKIKGSRFVNEAQKLYKLIWARFIASQMTRSVYDATTINVVAGLPAQAGKYLLRVSGQVIKFEGWRKVMPARAGGQKGGSEDAVELPKVKNGEKLDFVKVTPLQKFTQPPARFNEASLIKTLESLGIGRPSTYAPIISTIQARAYVEKKDRRFYPTPVGKAVTGFLIKNFPDILNYSFTAGMEDELDNIAKGEEKWQKMMKDFWEPFDKKLTEATEKSKRVKIETEKLGKKCPKCGKKDKGELVIRIGRFGKFISCSRFPDCDYTDKYLETIGMKCPTCEKGEVIVKKTRKGRQFFGCSRYPDCDFASWKNPKLKKEKSKN